MKLRTGTALSLVVLVSASGSAGSAPVSSEATRHQTVSPAIAATRSVGYRLFTIAEARPKGTLMNTNRPQRTEAKGTKIRLNVGGKIVTASLIDNATTRDFVSLLPLTMTMNDLFKREKFAHLPRAISDQGRRTRTYEVGHIIYWSPGPDVAIFYRHDGEAIPAPGIILMGKIDSGVEAFDALGSLDVTIDLSH